MSKLDGMEKTAVNRFKITLKNGFIWAQSLSVVVVDPKLNTSRILKKKFNLYKEFKIERNVYKQFRARILIVSIFLNSC